MKPNLTLIPCEEIDLYFLIKKIYNGSLYKGKEILIKKGKEIKKKQGKHNIVKHK